MLKQEARQWYSAQRKALPEVAWRQASEAIARRFFDTFELNRCQYVHCFLPIEAQKEVDTWLIVRRMWRDFEQVHVLTPRVRPNTYQMDTYWLRPQTTLVANQWGITEPEPKAERFGHLSAIDLVIVPLLAFDELGYRVGYGKGFYDRFLTECRPSVIKVGVSMFEATAVFGDTQTHDLRLDYCITPQKTYIF